MKNHGEMTGKIDGPARAGAGQLSGMAFAVCSGPDRLGIPREGVVVWPMGPDGSQGNPSGLDLAELLDDSWVEHRPFSGFWGCGEAQTKVEAAARLMELGAHWELGNQWLVMEKCWEHNLSFSMNERASREMGRLGLRQETADSIGSSNSKKRASL